MASGCVCVGVCDTYLAPEGGGMAGEEALVCGHHGVVGGGIQHKAHVQRHCDEHRG